MPRKQKATVCPIEGCDQPPYRPDGRYVGAKCEKHYREAQARNWKKRREKQRKAKEQERIEQLQEQYRLDALYQLWQQAPPMQAVYFAGVMLYGLTPDEQAGFWLVLAGLDMAIWQDAGRTVTFLHELKIEDKLSKTAQLTD